MKFTTLAASFTLATLLHSGVVAGAEPRREAGLSVHMLPERVAALSQKHGGFSVTDPRTGRVAQTLATAAELLGYFQALPASFRENGIWLVTSDPEAYSETEHRNLSSLVALCGKAKVSLFTCRAKDLPSGWKRSR